MQQVLTVAGNSSEQFRPTVSVLIWDGSGKGRMLPLENFFYIYGSQSAYLVHSPALLVDIMIAQKFKVKFFSNGYVCAYTVSFLQFYICC